MLFRPITYPRKGDSSQFFVIVVAFQFWQKKNKATDHFGVAMEIRHPPHGGDKTFLGLS